MSYNAYERIAGTSVIKSVEAHCRHLTTAGSFSTSSTPLLERVEQWIDEAYYYLQAQLAKEGYSVTIPASATAAVAFLEQLNVYGAVMQVELAHPITGRRGEENDRYKAYRDWYEAGVSIIATDALAVLGATRSTQLSAYTEVGGISRDRKKAAYDDADAVQSRFKRGLGRHPMVPEPTIGAGASTSGTAI